MLPRAEQKQQTRLALMDAARHLMESGRGFGSLSLREVAKTAGIVPTGFYRHFSDMDQLGLALVSEVGQTFRETIRLVRHNELFMGGVINASVRIFLDVVEANRSQFLIDLHSGGSAYKGLLNICFWSFVKFTVFQGGYRSGKVTFSDGTIANHYYFV